MQKKTYPFIIFLLILTLALFTSCPYFYRHAFSLGLATDGSGSGQLADDSTADGTYNGLFSVTAHAVPDPGSEFAGWYDSESGGNLVSTADLYTFEIQAPTHLFAKFSLPIVDSPPGTVRLYPATVECSVGDEIVTSVMVNTGSQKLASYSFNLTYDYTLLEPPGITKGASGPDPIYNEETPGTITMAIFDTAGIGPGENLQLVVITWEAKATGTALLELDVDTLTDEEYNDVGTPDGWDATITINGD